MDVIFKDRFGKDISKITDKNLKESIAGIIDKVKLAKSIHELSNVKRIKGHEAAYRIRIGDYRIGIFLYENTVIFATIRHRKNIYKSFP